jgi:hypothetical protein
MLSSAFGGWYSLYLAAPCFLGVDPACLVKTLWEKEYRRFQVNSMTVVKIVEIVTIVRVVTVVTFVTETRNSC